MTTISRFLTQDGMHSSILSIRAQGAKEPGFSTRLVTNSPFSGHFDDISNAEVQIAYGMKWALPRGRSAGKIDAKLLNRQLTHLAGENITQISVSKQRESGQHVAMTTTEKRLPPPVAMDHRQNTPGQCWRYGDNRLLHSFMEDSIRFTKSLQTAEILLYKLDLESAAGCYQLVAAFDEQDHLLVYPVNDEKQTSWIDLGNNL